jgi:hypothetical protein
MSDWGELLEQFGIEPKPGASEEEMRAAEARLGTSLPPDYRAFLRATNGLDGLADWVTRLRPAGELAWLRDEDPELIDVWAEAAGDDSLDRTLVLSDEEDGARVLLNPAAVADDGEWEAWFFAHWVPGAEPYPSFRALVEELRARQVQDEKAARGEPTPQVAPALGVGADDLAGLVAALQRARPEDRAMALDGIANLRDPTAAPAVVERLLDDSEDDYVREKAARTLGQLRDRRSAEALIAILRVPYPQGRRFDNRSEEQERAIGLKHPARQGLIGLGEVARPQLVAALDDPDAKLVAEVRQTLQYLNR